MEHAECDVIPQTVKQILFGAVTVCLHNRRASALSESVTHNK